MYQRPNQKALHADTNKNVEETTNTMRNDLAPINGRLFTEKKPAIGRKITTEL